MAAFELLLSRARHHCFSRTILRHHASSYPSFLCFYRLLSASPSSSPSPLPHEPNQQPQSIEPNQRSASIPLNPVSYPVKPKEDPSPPGEHPPPPPPRQQFESTRDFASNAEPHTLTREDIRFVKDLPAISPVSYPARVAPLPEYRPQDLAIEEDKGKGEIDGRSVQLEAERKRIEADNRLVRRVFRVEEEQNFPFPSLIKAEQKKQEKVIHDLKEAVKLVKANAKRNFDETVEAHVKLTAELRRTDLKLSGSLSLPHGSGKLLRVAVFAEGALADEARAAGADIVGGQELIERIKDGSVNVKDFDKFISTPQLMPRIGKEISKKLNRLTPNARDGSVTTDISRAVKEAKKNIDFKKDKTAIVHVGLGKASFTEEALCQNIGAFVNALLLAKPAGLKKSSKYAGYVSTFHICSSMGPSFPVSIQSLSLAADRYSKLQPR